jgi:phosphoribosylformylglycinamidine cyclo-ligase
MAKSRYAESGVSIDSGNLVEDKLGAIVRRTFTPRVLDNFGSFAGMMSLDFPQKLLKRNYKDPVLAGCTDGVGTKLKLAFMSGIHNTVGIDLVAMNVNDLVVIGAEPLFFLDYIAAGKIDPSIVLTVVGGIADGCRESGCALIGGETAEMPDFYADGEYDLAGFACGVVEKRRIINGRHIERGDVIIGLHSTGVHSNGYSLVRKIFFKDLKWEFDRRVDELGATIGETLLKPTRIYVKAVDAVKAFYKKKHILNGIAHITGGGLVENVPRVLPKGCMARIEKGTWPVPPVFGLMQSIGGVEEDEMFRVFNMGIGMVFVVPKYNVDVVLRILAKAKYPASVIGEIMPGKQTVKIE